MKTITTLIAAMLALVMLGAVAFATVTVPSNTYEALFDVNGNFVQTTSPVSNVNVIGFVCADATCTTTSGQLWNGQVLNTGNSNAINVQFPTQLQSQYGYVVYYYKPGYISWIETSNWAGTGTVTTPSDEYLTKVQSCSAPIDSFSVTDSVYPNQPVMVNVAASLDANTSSPLLWNNVVGFHPSQLTTYAQAQVTVTLDIVNSTGSVVNTQQQVLMLDPSSSQRTSFSYTPAVIDRYTARVHTTVTDAKCLASASQFSQKAFSVIAQGPTNQCYVLLNNLNVRPLNQTIGQPITISFDEISNAYDAQGVLSTLATAANVQIVQGGQTVFTQQLSIPANANTIAAQSASFQFTPNVTGFYTVTVNGFAQSCPYATATADTVSQSFYAYNNVTVPPTNNTNTTPNQAPVWLTIPGVTLQQNSGLHANLFNLNLYVIDPDSSQINFTLVSVSNPAVADCSVTQSGVVSCTAPVGGAIGTSTITIGAFDGVTLSASSFVVTVQAVVNPNGACTLPNGTLIPNTASQTYFQSATVPFGQSCVSEVRTCSNSVLSGSFTNPTCTVTPSTSCVDPNGAVLVNGTSQTYFQSALVPFGQTCVSQLRTCSNGVLSGTFAATTCVVGPQASSLGFDLPNNVQTVMRNSAGTIIFPDMTQYVINASGTLTFTLTAHNGSSSACHLAASNGKSLVCDAVHGQDGLDTYTVNVNNGAQAASDSVQIGVGIYNKKSTRGKNNEGLVILGFNVGDFGITNVNGGSIPVAYTIKNSVGHRLKDATIVVSVLDTGSVAQDGPVDLGSGAVKSGQLYLPVDATMQPGIYTVRMTISDATSGLIRIEHRDLVVE